MATYSQARWRMRFEERMETPSKPIRHKKTSVLLLTWDPEHDDLGVGPEVKELETTFKEDYGFVVYNKRITSDDGVKAQQQAQHFLSGFVAEEDEEQGLLIIYFAGHGYSEAYTKTGDIHITGKLSPASRKTAEAATLDRTGIIWSHVETTIGHTYSDILLIFDCCHAGRLSLPLRQISTYEFLGACPAQKTTRGPGHGSFTHALTSVLRDFANKKPFRTSELREAIMAYKDFPKQQKPVLAFRRPGPPEHIVISSNFLSHDHTEPTVSKAERIKERKNKQHIDLRLWFDDEVKLEHLDKTVDVLKPLMKSGDACWDSVEFIQKSCLVQRVFERWKEATSVGKNRQQSITTPQSDSLDNNVAAPELGSTLTLQIPAAPYATPMSETPVSSLGGLDGDGGEFYLSLPPRLIEEESIAYHVMGQHPEAP